MNLRFSNTKTIIEHQYTCTIDGNKHNFTLNPTILNKYNEVDSKFVSGSLFQPYITSIGLYNNNGVLLAIGKLSQPIQKLNNIDMNLIVKFDINN